MTIGQAALHFILAQKTIASVLPNLTNEPQLVEFTAASGLEGISSDDLAHIYDLYVDNFGLPQEQGASAR